LVASTCFALYASQTDGEALAVSTNSELRATLGVFARAQTRRDAFPLDPQARFTQASDAQPGEDLTRSRRVDLGTHGPVYLWPKSGGVCYGSPGGTGCVPVQLIRQRGIALALKGTIHRADLQYVGVRLFGIARDGIDSVRIGFADGRETAVSVTDNVFLADVGDMPQDIRWTDADGDHRELIEAIPDHKLEELRAR
jgi:hypothetical protein